MKKVKDIMKKTRTISPDLTIKEVLDIMEANTSFGLIVESEEKPIGIITDGDLLSAYCRYVANFSYEETISNENYNKRVKEFKSLKAKDLMTQRPRTIHEDASVIEAAEIIKKFKFRRLAVVDSAGKYLGLINRVGILKNAFE
ncbi:CBS domain-containing protein [Candidatus Micrarchaeota archaeon]|nr:CBS domain-containing protein [Candidatus Micrarchaeota archaeon]